MGESLNEITVDRKLLDIFEEAFNLYYSFETCNDPTNSPEFQVSLMFDSESEMTSNFMRNFFVLGKNKEMYSTI